MLRIKTLALSAAAAAAAGLLSVAVSPATPSHAADLYPYGQCTYYAKAMRPDVSNHWGDARFWAYGARAAGFPVSSQPQVGDVVVFGRNIQGRSPYGHVGIVVAVQGNRFKIDSMWGNEATGRVHVTWHHTGYGVSFIHRRGSAAATSTHKKAATKAKASVKHATPKHPVVHHTTTHPVVHHTTTHPVVHHTTPTTTTHPLGHR
ncbi:MAG TPA: CHAP domain-containing protein [Chloroflexia bacterium]|nr:CHAP domain-containing protein [Chloroflexia bacterium]